MNHNVGDIVLFSFHQNGRVSTTCEIIAIDNDRVFGELINGSTIEFSLKNILVNYNNLPIVLTRGALKKIIDQRIDPINLKPCPWCKQIPNIWNTVVKNHVCIQCSNRKCKIRPIVEGYIIHAINDWNGWIEN